MHIAQRLGVSPLAARRRHVKAALFVGVYLFLTVRFRRPRARQIVVRLAAVGTASRNSASVRSGWAVTKARKRFSWSVANARPRNFVCGRGPISPVSRRRCTSRCTDARLTRYFAATSSALMPASQSVNTRVRKSIE
jgi:hypothetical protein